MSNLQVKGPNIALIFGPGLLSGPKPNINLQFISLSLDFDLDLDLLFQYTLSFPIMASLRSPISLLLAFSLLSLLLLFFSNLTPLNPPRNPNLTTITTTSRLRVLVADIPPSFNYGLLHLYWSLSSPDSRINADPDSHLRPKIRSSRPSHPPYPSNPLINQYSAEYWLLGDLETPEDQRSESSVAQRVRDGEEEYDVVFVPFFATLSAEMELGWGKKGGFLKKDEGLNGDYRRQRELVERLKSSKPWKRSGGRDHVFVLTGIR